MKICCFGDSNTYCYDPRSYFGGRYNTEYRWVDILADKCGCDIRNDGMNGREIPDGDESIVFSEKLVIIMLGTNDLLQGSNARTTAEKMERLLQNLESKKQKVILIAPPPFRLGEWVPDQMLIQESIALGNYYSEIAQKYDIPFANAAEWNISITFDGVHFTEEGHKAFANCIYEYLKTCNLVN